MHLDEEHIDSLLDFVKRAGRNQEDSEAWALALIDIQNSYEIILINYYRKCWHALNPLAMSAKYFGIFGKSLGISSTT